jgi:hypothetical protein
MMHPATRALDLFEIRGSCVRSLGSNAMLDVLVIIPTCGLARWRNDNSEQIAFIQLGTQTGRFEDGKKFRFVVINDHDWLDRLRGIRFREYRIERGCNLTTREISALQAMMQIS